MQQINLYQPIFKQQEKVFSAKTLLQAGLFVLAGLMTMYGYALWQTQAVERQLQTFEQQRTQAQQRLAEVVKQFGGKKRDPALEKRLEERRSYLAAKRSVVGVLSGPSFGNKRGFSDELEAFARQRPAQLWLRRVTLTDGGSTIVLEGSSYQPEQIPQFVQRLGREPSMAGTAFGSFLLSRSEEQPRQVDFVLRTRPDAEGKPK